MSVRHHRLLFVAERMTRALGFAGDAFELDALDGKPVYRVERTWVVDPEDVSVLGPTSTPALTLVTCHPFYFIGSAHRLHGPRVPSADSGCSSRCSGLLTSRERFVSSTLRRMERLR